MVNWKRKKKNKQMGKYIKEIHLPKKTDTKEYILVMVAKKKTVF